MDAIDNSDCFLCVSDDDVLVFMRMGLFGLFESSSVTSVSSFPRVRALPVSLSLGLNPHPAGLEMHRILPVFIYPSIEGEVAALAVVLREGGYQLVQLDSHGFGSVLFPSPSINLIREMELEILRSVDVEFRRGLFL